MGGTACNGWRFWSLAEQAAEKAEAPKKEPKAKKNGSAKPETVACGECGETFATAAEVTEHMATAHTEASTES